jgi:homogentisate 1,2-dioxygenase
VNTPEIRTAALNALGDWAKEWDIRRALIVTGPSQRYVPATRAALDGLAVDVFSEAQRHVPRSNLARASDALRAAAPELVISVGGGSSTGLVKALRLEHDFRFIAVPTTYAGSELTNLYGITDGGNKQTGRDDRVRPDGVLYDVELTLTMPLALTVTSLFNALAHPLSVWLRRAEAGEDVVQAPDYEQLREPVVTLFGTIETLLRWPAQRAARAAALACAGRAALALEQGDVGVQHRLAHTLGGHFDLEHGALHALLLPHTVSRLREISPRLVDALSEQLGCDDLEAALFDFLQRAQAPLGLRNLGVALPELQQLLEARPEFPPEFVRAAYHARRPSRHVQRAAMGLRELVSLRGPQLTAARRVVLALHGRGSSADVILRRCTEITGLDDGLALVAPQAPNNTWYELRHTETRAAHGEALTTSLSELLRLIALIRSATQAPLVVMGFSQGACLALEVLSRTEHRLAAVVALSGSAIGGSSEAPTFGPHVRGLAVLLGSSEDDPWLDMGDLHDTRDRLLAAGAQVTFELVPGDAHALHARHRLLARELLTGKANPLPLHGFSNAQQSECLPGALPTDRNSPRDPAYGLYAEQLSVTGFVAQRAQQRRAWLYRVRPSAEHGAFEHILHSRFNTAFTGEPAEPELAGCAPLPLPTAACDFLDGVCTLGGAGSPALRRGYAIHLYACNRNMEERAFCNTDGELLLLPELGRLTLLTEFGVLDVEPGMLAIIPRGVRFSVVLRDGVARGYMTEVYGRSFDLPERGPVGANGLTDPRHFVSPHAWYEDRLALGYAVVHKLGGALYEAKQDYSPYSVVAWHGNCPPHAYDLQHFCPVSNSRFDHIDPSIYTVLSAPLDEVGAHNLDLVVFPPRWDVSENTFRPPYFHRNVTTEFNGIIRELPSNTSPFVPGCCFLTPSFTPHGVVATSAVRARLKHGAAANRPHRMSEASLWFQFETTLPFSFSPWVKQAANWRADWGSIWGAYRNHFRPQP